MSHEKPFLTKKTLFCDEVNVWFTSIGLTLAIVMVVFLLGLVVFNGFQVFLPRAIAEIELKDVSAGIRQSATLAGEITKKRLKAPTRLASSEIPHEEIQLYLANKDIYGISFFYVDMNQIKKISYPRDLVSIERMEYGDAIGHFERIVFRDGSTMDAKNPLFQKQLDGLVSEAVQVRRAIRTIEKDQIGRINRVMESIRLKEKSRSGPSPFVDKKNELEKKYQVLAAQARRLRADQNGSFLVIRLSTGEEKKIPIGQIVSYYFANQLNFWDRCLIFTKNFWQFLSGEPREANTEGGIFPAIFGTFVMTLIMSVAVTPFGVLAAIYLREYASQGWLVRCVRISINNLAGVPSIVFGVFGVGFFVYFVGGSIDSVFFRNTLPTPTFGTGGILWASLTLALMTVPVVIVATEEALAAVSRGVREGSLACGASKWQTIQHVVLPASAPGIMTGLILAMARGAGEVAPLMLVGVVKLAPSMPLDSVFPFFHLDRKFMHLGFHIYDLGFQSPDSEAAKPMVFATTFFLIALVVLLNMAAITIRERLRRKYAVGAF